MTEPRPLTRPDHLAPLDGGGRGLARRAAATIAAVLGAASFCGVAISQGSVWETPDAWVSVPGFVATLAAAGWSVARRERATWWWASGLALAAAGLVLGWFLILAIVLGVAAAAIVLLHALL